MSMKVTDEELERARQRKSKEKSDDEWSASGLVCAEAK